MQFDGHLPFYYYLYYNTYFIMDQKFKNLKLYSHTLER
jgi:hypothetical protein